MSHVVCEPCRNCKYTECVTVCPCDSFYQDEVQLYIDPDSCIDCQACQTECPVEAIYMDVDIPNDWNSFIELNAERVSVLKGMEGSHITERQTPKCG